MNAFYFSLASLLSTLAGGLLALRLRERLHQLLGFTAGVLLGVAAFDLVPESLALARRVGHGGQGALIALLAAFLLLHTLQRVARRRGLRAVPHRGANGGLIPVVALVAHSFFDGIGIGLAFHVSPEVGWTVACAVIAHDFCDGLNTVSLMLARRHAPARTLAMLALDAIAPVLGAASTYAFSVPAGALAIALGFFAGSLLYVGAVDLLPQARSRAGSTAASLVGLTALGITFAYAVVRAAG